MKMMMLMLMISVTNIFAQSPVSKGTYSVGGEISFTSQSQNDDSESDIYFNVAPNLGYFFIDNLYSGISVQYLYTSFDNLSINHYGIGPLLRYYFDVNQIKPFLGVGIDYFYYKMENSSEGNSQTSIKLSGGIDYFITNYFALEASINYRVTFLSYSDNNINQFNIGIGARYFIQ